MAGEPARPPTATSVGRAPGRGLGPWPPARTGRWLARGVLGVPEEGADHLGGVQERVRRADRHRPGRGRGGLALEPAAVDGVLGAVRRAGMQDLKFLPAVVV